MDGELWQTVVDCVFTVIIMSMPEPTTMPMLETDRAVFIVRLMPEPKWGGLKRHPKPRPMPMLKIDKVASSVMPVLETYGTVFSIMHMLMPNTKSLPRLET